MDIDSLAQALFGSPRAETQEVATDGTTRTYMGVAMSDSEGGTVVVDLGGDVTLPDDLYDEDGNVVAEWDGVGVEMPTSPQVSAGDDVIVTLMGGSSTKTPMVTSSAGSGDRMRALINAAQTVADAAQEVAEAVNQHFFADTNGIHVTEATQEDWDESHTGANVLINSVGQLFRDGLNNLLAILTSGIVIYDGNGNDEENVVASFTGDEIHLGNLRISTLNLGESLQGGWLYSDSLTMASAVNEHAGEVTNGVHVGDGSIDMSVTSRTTFGYRAPIDDGGSIIGYETVREQKSARETFAWYRSPVGTYTGTNSTATASASGWQLTYFNTVVAEVGSPRTYDYSFSNGVLTATRDCVLEISGVMNWTDALAGNRGFGIFEGTTVGSGTEASSFQNFPSGVSNRKSVIFPPKMFVLSAGDSLTFGRYQQANAVYQNGTNYSWITIRVVG